MLPDDSKEKLIYPCDCKNYYNLVHRTCIQNTMRISNNPKCSICNVNFRIGYPRNKITSWVNIYEKIQF